MRINDPKMMAGFTINPTVDERQNKLATIKQLKNEINALNDRFETLLKGSEGTYMNGVGGLLSKCGYAWLNTTGKIDPSLIPPLAVTETHVIFQNDLPAVSNPTPAIIDYNISVYIKEAMAQNPSLLFQKGDFIIVYPSDDALPETNDYIGTYIIADAPLQGSNEPYQFVKLPQADADVESLMNKINAVKEDITTLSTALSSIEPTEECDAYNLPIYKIENELPPSSKWITELSAEQWDDYDIVENERKVIVIDKYSFTGTILNFPTIKSIIDEDKVRTCEVWIKTMPGPNGHIITMNVPNSYHIVNEDNFPTEFSGNDSTKSYVYFVFVLRFVPRINGSIAEISFSHSFESNGSI